MVLWKISASEGESELFSESDRGMRILSVSSGSVSLASFCFRLSLDERFHKIPAHTHDREDQHHGHTRLIFYTHLFKTQAKVNIIQASPVLFCFLS